MSIVRAAALMATALLEAKDRASATYQSAAVDVTDYEGVAEIVQTCVSATGAQTEAAVIETSDDSGFGSGVVTVATFTTYTQSDLKRVQRRTVDLNACKRYLRVNATLAGSTPAISSSYTFSAVKKYQ